MAIPSQSFAKSYGLQASLNWENW